MGKSRYRNYWYGIVLKMLQRYPGIKDEETIQSSIFTMAINKALDETRELPDGELRITAMEMIYFKGTHSIDGAALELHSSRRTIQRWCSSFVYLVGKHAGYV